MIEESEGESGFEDFREIEERKIRLGWSGIIISFLYFA